MADRPVPPRRYYWKGGCLTPKPGFLPPLQAIACCDSIGRRAAGLDNPDDYAACHMVAMGELKTMRREMDG